MIVRKTEKDYLIDSAIELFSRYSISKVTVKDICENCDTSRRTYYNYFKDKNDIVTQCFVTLTRQYYDNHVHEMTMHSLLLFMAEEVCANAGFFRNAFSYKGQNNIRRSLVTPMISILEELYVDKWHSEPDQTVRNALLFFIYGMLSYIEEKIVSERIPDAQTAVAFFENAMPEILVKAYYQN